MNYLLPADYAAYGLAAETADAWVTAASAMMDAYCRRPTLAAASYVERMRVGARSQSVRLSYAPLLSVDDARARFARLRDGMPCPLGAEVAAAFGAGDSWVTLDVTQLDVFAATGEVRLPWNVLGVPYGELEVTYTAGFSDVPTAIKVACAQIVRNAQATPGLNVKQGRVDTLQMEYFSDSLLDSQVQAILRPFVAERLS